MPATEGKDSHEPETWTKEQVQRWWSEAPEHIEEFIPTPEPPVARPDLRLTLSQLRRISDYPGDIDWLVEELGPHGAARILGVDP